MQAAGWRPYWLALTLARLRGICQACQLNPIADGYLCCDCHNDTPWLPMPFEVVLLGVDVSDVNLRVQAASYYDGVMKSAISSFKDKESLLALPYLLHALGVLASAMCQQLPEQTVILAVPTTDARLRTRGFDPVDILARHLSVLTGFRVYRGVVRVGEQMHQRKLNRQERLDNLRNAFMLHHLPDVQHVLLFDDVTTTGATFRALAETLLAADKDIGLHACCLAHGKRHYHERVKI